MKKIILISILLLISLIVYSQGLDIATSPSNTYFIYIGSLDANKDDLSNNGKLKIELYGGDHAGGVMSRTTYTIKTRYGYAINKEAIGGGTSNKLKAYKNKEQIDIIIMITPSWSMYNIRAWSGGTELNLSQANYDINNKIDVTSSFYMNSHFVSDAAGNVGIGTSSPQAKLDVRGKIIVDEVEIKVNKGADFVFDSNHKLPSLSEVETHIKENNHLPDIPSEKEMIENGVDLGEMQIKLLQKIEELTLYAIEQNKQIQRLQEENKEMKNILKNK